MKTWKPRIATAAGLVLATAPLVALEPPAANAAAVDNTEAVVVGMPANVRWAYYGSPKAPAGSDTIDSAPAYHATYGKDWATDLYAPEGTALHLRLSGATGRVTTRYSVTDGGCGAGKRVRVYISVDSHPLGYVQYEHLNINNTHFSDGISNNEFLGRTHQWPKSSCYQVSSPAGVHTHVGFYQNNRYSCWSDYGKVGTTVHDSDPLGVLGSNNLTARGACTPGRSVSSYKGQIVQWSGDTKTQKTAWLVKSDLKRYWIPDIATYNCLKRKGVPGPVRLPGKVLSLLTDRTGYRSGC